LKQNGSNIVQHGEHFQVRPARILGGRSVFFEAIRDIPKSTKMAMSNKRTQALDEPEITLSMVADLIAEQFPQWARLPIRPVEFSGWDNRTFHLGETMSIRLPSAERYAPQTLKEQEWLPKLAPNLSFPIPKPLALGKPSKNYPWHWSVYEWIEGVGANTLQGEHFVNFSLDAAKFLNELRRIDVAGGPLAGAHNFYRGASPLVYDAETRSAIARLSGLVHPDAAIGVWEKAISSEWRMPPVWVHGDFSPGNLLVKSGQLGAVIDFGSLGVGDPACDLVIAWTFLTRESRKIFMANLGLDADTWDRARGWGLWKALITLVQLEDKSCPEALKNLQVVDTILSDP
jgi:aminoglycoside phosphotransferase (APT) family kinase protein